MFYSLTQINTCEGHTKKLKRTLSLRKDSNDFLIYSLLLPCAYRSGLYLLNPEVRL